MTSTDQHGPEMLSAIVESTDDAIVAVDAASRVSVWNGAAEELFGVRRSMAIGRSVSELVAAEGRSGDTERRVLARALRGETVRYESRRLRRQQMLRLAMTVTPLRGEQDEVVGAVAVSRDVTDERRLEEALARREQHARYLAMASERLAVSLDPVETLATLTALLVPALGDVCMIAMRAGQRLQIVEAEHIDTLKAGQFRAMLRKVDNIMSPTGPAMEVLNSAAPLLIDDLPPATETRYGSTREHKEMVELLQIRSLAVAPIRAGGEVLGIIEVLTSKVDSDRRLDGDDLALLQAIGDRGGQALLNARMHQALRAAQAQFRAAFEHAPIGMALVDAGEGAAQLMVEANPALCSMLGYTRDELVGRSVVDLQHADDREPAVAMSNTRALLRGELEDYATDRRLLRSDGGVIWAQVHAAPFEGDDVEPHLVVQIQDVTERREHEEQLRHLADHDPLTGLVNRRRFGEELDRLAALATRYETSAAVLVVDVDRFKDINDSYGHAVGDDLLRSLASVLRARCRETDVIGRLGGDEFGVILPHSGPAEAAATAEALVAAIRSGCTASVGGRDLRVSASAGLRIVSAGAGGAARCADDGALVADALLAEADIALYDAKERGRDRVSIVGQGSVEPERARARLVWSERIRDALDDEGFVLYEQPILGLASGQVERTEVLVRMVADGRRLGDRAGRVPRGRRTVRADPRARPMGDRPGRSGCSSCGTWRASGSGWRSTCRVRRSPTAPSSISSRPVRRASIDPTHAHVRGHRDGGDREHRAGAGAGRRLADLGCGSRWTTSGQGSGRSTT